MKVLNDFKCINCGTQAERFLENTINVVDCRHCEGTAKKVRTVPNFMLPGNDPAGFPTAADRWVKKREQKIAQELKSENA